jgi:mannan endo-1,4-beta-mannosidase
MRIWIAIALLFIGCATAHQPATLSASRGALTDQSSMACLNVTFDCPGGACNVTVNNPAIDAGLPVADASAPVDATVPDAAVVDAAPAADASKPVDASVVDATAKDAAAVDASPAPVPDASVPPSGVVARPAASRGVGFYVVGSKLYDANGVEFRIRGLNRVHWDSNSPGIAATGANTQRWIIDFSRSATANLTLMQQDIAQRRVTVPGNWGTKSCPDTASDLSAIVDTWVAQAAQWNTIERYSIINIVNEWGPPAANSTVWRDSYVTAVQRMRAAGYHGTLMIDASGCGQDPDAIPMFGAAVLAADPEHNIVFSQHIYGFYGSPNYPGQQWSQTTIESQMARLKATGLAIVIGEYGPGANIGPSPTTIDPVYVMQLANANGFGHLAWAIDDGPATGRGDDWFALTRDGTYTKSSDLTAFGVKVIEGSPYGIKMTAQTATVFP